MPTSTRRGNPTRTLIPSTKKAFKSTDKLAEEFASRLAVSGENGKQRAAVLSGEQVRLSAMRSVNSASQALSMIVQSGWKKVSRVPPSKQSAALAKVNASIAQAAKHLTILREMCPNDIDVERAAVSVLGKLIALEMYDDAMGALEKIHPRICSLLNVVPPMSHPNMRLRLLSIPIPPSNPPAEPVLLTLTSTYLAYAISVVVHASTLTRNPDDKTLSLKAVSNVLNTEPTLLAWMPCFSPLPFKHTDSVLTRAYTALTKSYITCKTHSKEVFLMRMYAVNCLAGTSAGTFNPNTFWHQATRLGGTLVESSNSSENEVGQIILRAYSDLVNTIERRVDKSEILSGKGFLSFSEYWMSFAKKVGDFCTLNRIVTLIQGDLGSEVRNRTGEQDVACSSNDRAPGEEVHLHKGKNDLIVEGSKLCATLAHLTALLEQRGPDMIMQAQKTTDLLEKSNVLVKLLADRNSSDERIRRAGSKVDRALERLRRAGISVLDDFSATTRTPDDDQEAVRALLGTILSVFQGLMYSKPHPDLYTRSLDTLFALARVTMNIIDPRTYSSAYDYLTRALSILEIPVSDPDIDRANYTRCISGALNNLAGMLYRGGKHGAAIGFLKDGCVLGAKALSMHRSGVATNGDDKTEEGWRQLREQLYRRWELLGVCYSKIGDRKQAFGAFVESVKAFPYSESGFVQQNCRRSLSCLFNLSDGTKQLATIVDRVSYLGACDLLLNPSSVSLKIAGLENAGNTGTLLERQVESLEGSAWKDGVQRVVAQLLKDILQIYKQDTMPIRRTRVLLKCMDFSYHTNSETLAGFESPEQMGEQIEMLLKSENLGQDIELAPFCSQYRASAHLWLALHAHRRTDVKQSTIIAHHTEEAYKILMTLLGTPASKSVKKSSPKHIAVSKKLTRDPLASCLHRAKTPSREHTTSNTHNALQPISLNPVISLPDEVKKPLLLFDDPEKLLTLLQLTARILGLLALTLLKVHVLDIVRKLCEWHTGILSNSYILASVDLAHEYVVLGKTKYASTIFDHLSRHVRSGSVSDEACTYFLLGFAESLATAEDVPQSSNIYREAFAMSEKIDVEDKGLPTLQRVYTRVRCLERAALASQVFALIQYSKEDVPASIDGLLQSLRLWNRAGDNLARLKLSPKPTEDSNPFQLASLRDALPDTGTEGSLQEVSLSRRSSSHRPPMNVLEWRISEGLLSTLFTLAKMYNTRGSAREAEYFAQQAQDIAESLNIPPMVSRALAKKGEVQLHLGQLEDSLRNLTKASELMNDLPGIDSADVHRLHGEYNERTSQHTNAQRLYQETMTILEELDLGLKQFDRSAFQQKSLNIYPMANSTGEIIVPGLLATVLRQHIWLLRDNNVQDYTAFLDKLSLLPSSSRTKAEEHALKAKLGLYDVYRRFRTDMFFSSLAESTIALPMGMSSKTELAFPPLTQDILNLLDSAEGLSWENLALTAQTGDVVNVRDTLVSLGLIRALQTSLGKSTRAGPSLTVGLLDVAAAITLRREILGAIQYKFPALQVSDDLQWPSIDVHGNRCPPPINRLSRPLALRDLEDLEDDEESHSGENPLRGYWESVRSRYQSRVLDSSSLSMSQMSGLPDNWTVVHISVTEDKSTLFITRQEGSDDSVPLIFCVPLKGRRDSANGEVEEEYLTFDDALEELKDIVRLSDEGTRSAVHIKADNRALRASWWKERSRLDTRMRELLENIEFCWLGAFKTILSPRPNLTPNLISDLRNQFERVFQRNLPLQEKPSKQRSGAHKKTVSQGQAPSQVTFDNALIECFSTLSPKCRDEELEDLVYFVLDLYQFHGIPVAIAEVDVVQVVVDLRGVLEEHALKISRRKLDCTRHDSIRETDDEHLFLVLDRNVQGLPWESIPILRGRSVSRIPSVEFLHDRISFAEWKRRALGEISSTTRPGGAIVDPRKGYFILNPSGDLGKTEARFRDWAKDMEQIGWEGITGHAPSEQQFLEALRDQDLVVYFGHGGGEQYIRSHKIRNLLRCAATMLWGCSSGMLREMGDFDRVGTPYNYMLAGCPTLVANLWDVTDGDIDKFSQSVFDKLRLTAKGIKDWGAGLQDGQTSVVSAVAQSRKSCKLEYLTGAAPVVYGIPFYI